MQKEYRILATCYDTCPPFMHGAAVIWENILCTVVIATGLPDGWKAYQAIIQHHCEGDPVLIQGVAALGTKMEPALAKAKFPQFKPEMCDC